VSPPEMIVPVLVIAVLEHSLAEVHVAAFGVHVTEGVAEKFVPKIVNVPPAEPATKLVGLMLFI